jgi:hypothetical protein
MSVRSPSPSQFRPKTGIDQSVLENNKALLAEVDRRKFLRGSLSLGALAMLTGCDVTSQDTVQAALRAVSSFNERSGVNLRHFLERVGADLKAKYVAFRCADDYSGSIDMATALHPQTILATKYARQPIADPFGFPLRLRTATKLGFKNPKWITAIEVTNTDPGGYWEDRGFNWFAGI